MQNLDFGIRILRIVSSFEIGISNFSLSLSPIPYTLYAVLKK